LPLAALEIRKGRPCAVPSTFTGFRSNSGERKRGEENASFSLGAIGAAY
jgi:hypothetical protein